jgi:phosphatidylglycerophosphatase A
MRIIHFLTATGFGMGYSPIAPGTAGSLLASIFAYFILSGDAVLLSIMTFLFFFIGVYSSTYVEKDLSREDPSIVVVDEMVGMWISLIFIPPLWWKYLIAFTLFRFFDIIKPFPVNKLQNLPEGWGIMLDDVGAGIYALLATHIVLVFI